MGVKDFLQWQWSDYASKHRDRVNLMIHIVVVPCFQAGTILVLAAAAARSLTWAAAGGCGWLLAVAAEGAGHSREAERAAPFTSAWDFIRRFFSEQWVTFPRFVITGGWKRNLQAVGRRS